MWITFSKLKKQQDQNLVLQNRTYLKSKRGWDFYRLRSDHQHATGQFIDFHFHSYPPSIKKTKQKIYFLGLQYLPYLWSKRRWDLFGSKSDHQQLLVNLLTFLYFPLWPKMGFLKSKWPRGLFMSSNGKWEGATYRGEEGF